MAKIRLKNAIAEFDGMLYEVGINPVKQEEPEENLAPKSHRSCNGVATQAQEQQPEHLKLALAYARAVLAIPELRARYQALARRQGKRPRDVAMADYLKGIDVPSN